MSNYDWVDSSFVLNSNPSCVICDLDGTLSIFRNMDGTFIRDPFDCSSCGNDMINNPLNIILCALQASGKKIVFITGRDVKYEDETHKFLEKTCLRLDYELWMRKSGDKRDDCIVKREIYDNVICGRYIPFCVFEDRPKVVRMWRELGLFVFDCNHYVGSVVDAKFDKYFNKE